MFIQLGCAACFLGLGRFVQIFDPVLGDRKFTICNECSGRSIFLL